MRRCWLAGMAGLVAWAATLRAAVPAFELTEANGQPLGRADLAGKVWVAAFTFTRCTTICPVMMHRLAELQQQLPAGSGVWLVCISVDPEHDTPAVLTEHAARYGADRSRWKFLTGARKQIWQLARHGFHLAVDDAPPGDGDLIIHSSKFALVDPHGEIRGYYDGLDPATVPRLKRDAILLTPAGRWPRLNAILNGTSAVLLVTGFIFIRRQKRAAHALCMAGALVVSAAFLAGYLSYHAQAGSVRFTGVGLARAAYLAVLLSHTVLAAVAALWLVPVTALRAARQRWDAHRRVARWTLPVWLYVSVTGVVIYFVLYQGA